MAQQQLTREPVSPTPLSDDEMDVEQPKACVDLTVLQGVVKFQVYQKVTGNLVELKTVRFSELSLLDLVKQLSVPKKKKDGTVTGYAVSFVGVWSYTRHKYEEGEKITGRSIGQLAGLVARWLTYIDAIQIVDGRTNGEIIDAVVKRVRDEVRGKDAPPQWAIDNNAELGLQDALDVSHPRVPLDKLEYLEQCQRRCRAWDAEQDVEAYVTGTVRTAEEALEPPKPKRARSAPKKANK